MNLNDSEFEQQLRLMRPRPPGNALEEKIAAALSQHEVVRAERVPTAAVLRGTQPAPAAFTRWLQGLGWALAGAAAAIVAIVLMDGGETGRLPALAETAATAPVEAFEHSESSEELVTAEDEGLVLDADRAPARQVRYHSLERHVWIDSITGTRMEVEIPREDVRLVSVAMQ